MRPLIVGSILVWAAAAIACGGKVVFEEQNEGGSGTTGTGATKATTGTKMTTQVATTGQTTSSGNCSIPGEPPPMNCNQACMIVYVCGQTFCGGNQQLCPAFAPGNVDVKAFMNGCINLCQSQMALISIVDADHCDVTIETLQGVSADFAQVCSGGL